MGCSVTFQYVYTMCNDQVSTVVVDRCCFNGVFRGESKIIVVSSSLWFTVISGELVYGAAIH
jgi:hypothetical protein